MVARGSKRYWLKVSFGKSERLPLRLERNQKNLEYSSMLRISRPHVEDSNPQITGDIAYFGNQQQMVKDIRWTLNSMLTDVMVILDCAARAGTTGLEAVCLAAVFNRDEVEYEGTPCGLGLSLLPFQAVTDVELKQKQREDEVTQKWSGLKGSGRSCSFKITLPPMTTGYFKNHGESHRFDKISLIAGGDFVISERAEDVRDMRATIKMQRQWNFVYHAESSKGGITPSSSTESALPRNTRSESCIQLALSDLEAHPQWTKPLEYPCSEVINELSVRPASQQDIHPLSLSTYLPTDTYGFCADNSSRDIQALFGGDWTFSNGNDLYAEGF